MCRTFEPTMPPSPRQIVGHSIAASPQRASRRAVCVDARTAALVQFLNPRHTILSAIIVRAATVSGRASR
jgi:hypothetical protein